MTREREPLPRATDPQTNAEIVERLKGRDRSAGPSTTDIVEAVRDSRRRSSHDPDQLSAPPMVRYTSMDETDISGVRDGEDPH